MFISTRAKVYATIVVTISLLLGMATWSILIQQEIIDNTILAQKSLGRQSQLAGEAQIHFKRQLKEWNNILLNGENPESYQRHLMQFENEESLVKEKMAALLPMIKTDSLRSLAQAFCDNHITLGESYRRTLEHSSGDLDGVDAGVRGVEKKPSDALARLVDRLSDQATRQVSTMQEKVQWSQYGFAALIIMGTTLTAALIWSTSRKWLKELSQDTITGLLNRRELTILIHRLIKQREPGFFLHIDLDQFKLVNELYGHHRADMALRVIGHRLRKYVGPTSPIARLNADEFAIVLPRASEETALALGEGIRSMVAEQKFGWDGQDVKITCSIAVLDMQKGFNNSELLLTQSALILQEAKEAGRNRVIMHNKIHDSLLSRQRLMRVVHDIHRALDVRDFVLYRQEIRALNPDADTYYEVLLRMKDDNGETVSPGTFLPAAEKYQLANAIDRHVIEILFHYLQSTPEDTDSYSVNLSGETLSDPTFTDFIRTQLRHAEFSTNRVSFEITETEAVKRIDTAQAILNVIRSGGCKVALDDFGSGLSGFQYLTTLGVDTVKIDGRFIRDIVDNATSVAIVRAVVDIAGTMDMKVVAEFVENEAQLNTLRELRVDYAQGFGLHKPAFLTGSIL